jgi:hypothetical protein
MILKLELKLMKESYHEDFKLLEKEIELDKEST